MIRRCVHFITHSWCFRLILTTAVVCVCGCGCALVIAAISMSLLRQEIYGVAQCNEFTNGSFTVANISMANNKGQVIDMAKDVKWLTTTEKPCGGRTTVGRGGTEIRIQHDVTMPPPPPPPLPPAVEVGAVPRGSGRAVASSATEA